MNNDREIGRNFVKNHNKKGLNPNALDLDICCQNHSPE